MWKDLTLQQKAEIMKMSVANGVTDINDIRALYDGSVGHRFDDGSRIITLGQFPEGFVEEYGNTTISTPSNKNRTTLREAFNDPAWRALHVDVNSVPYLTDYLLRQDQAASIKPSEGPTHKKDFATSFNEWKEEHPLLYTTASILPVTGTVMDGLDLYANPNLENAGWFAADLALDLLGARFLGKAAKGISKADDLSNLTRRRWAAKSKGKPSYYYRGPSTASKNALSPEEIEMLSNAAGTAGAVVTDVGTNLMQQQIEWNKKALGGHLYKRGGNKQQLGIIDSILTRHGVNYTKTSGYRGPNSKVGKLGSKSAHARTLSDGSSAAIDIVPGPGSSWDKLYAQMSMPEVKADLAKYGLDILDETDAATMRRTGATGKHFHVGKGIKGQQGEGVFVNSSNPTISAYHKMYGKPDLSISNDVLYNPAQELRWQQVPLQNSLQAMQLAQIPMQITMPRIETTPITPIEERVPISDTLPDISPLLLSLPDQQGFTPHRMVTPQYQPVDLNLDSPYLLFRS